MVPCRTLADHPNMFTRSTFFCASFAALQRPSVSLPDDLERLVEQVYGAEHLEISENWKSALQESLRDLVDERKSQRRNARGLVVNEPDDEELFTQQNAQLEEDNPEVAERIRAATRDTEPTVQLIVVFRIDGRDFLDADATEPFDETELPSASQMRRLLDNEITINHAGCVAFYAIVKCQAVGDAAACCGTIGSSGLTSADSQDLTSSPWL